MAHNTHLLVLAVLSRAVFEPGAAQVIGCP